MLAMKPPRGVSATKVMARARSAARGSSRGVPDPTWPSPRGQARSGRRAGSSPSRSSVGDPGATIEARTPVPSSFHLQVVDHRYRGGFGRSVGAHVRPLTQARTSEPTKIRSPRWRSIDARNAPRAGNTVRTDQVDLGWELLAGDLTHLAECVTCAATSTCDLPSASSSSSTAPLTESGAVTSRSPMAAPRPRGSGPPAPRTSPPDAHQARQDRVGRVDGMRLAYAPTEAPATRAGRQSGSGRNGHQSSLQRVGTVMGRCGETAHVARVDAHDWPRRPRSARIRLNSFSSATRASSRASCAPRQKCAPWPNVSRFAVSRPMTKSSGCRTRARRDWPDPTSSTTAIPVGASSGRAAQIARHGARERLRRAVVAQRLLDPARNSVGSSYEATLIGVPPANRPRCRGASSSSRYRRSTIRNRKPMTSSSVEPVAVDLGREQRRRQVVGGLLRRSATICW